MINDNEIVFGDLHGADTPDRQVKVKEETIITIVDDLEHTIKHGCDDINKNIDKMLNNTLDPGITRRILDEIELRKKEMKKMAKSQSVRLKTVLNR